MSAIDDAWAEVEELLPDGSQVTVSSHRAISGHEPERYYTAKTVRWRAIGVWSGRCASPTEALHSLATALRSGEQEKPMP